MPDSESIVTKLAQSYHERALRGDEHLHFSDTNVVTWRKGPIRCHLIVPSEVTEGVGMLQVHEHEDEDSTHTYTRYLFNDTAIIEKVSCEIDQIGHDTITREAFEDMMYDLAKLSDDELTSDDEDKFFSALLGVPGSPEV